jgi:hypothetical protein
MVNAPSRAGGAAGLRGLGRGGQANFRNVEGRVVAHGANNYTRNSYASYGTGRGYGHGYRYGAYAAAAAAGYGYGRSSSPEDSCYYVTSYKRYRHQRVLVCD